MNKVIFSENPSAPNRTYSLAHQQTLRDTIKYSEQLGFKRALVDMPFKYRPRYYSGLISSWLAADVLAAVYPSFCRYCMIKSNPFRVCDDILFELLYRLKGQRRTILFLYDLPIDQGIYGGKREFYDAYSYKVESRIFSCFDVLCVFSVAMRDVIRKRNAFPEEKFVEFECHDFGVKPSMKTRRRIRRETWNVVYIGNGVKSYAGDWMNELPISAKVRYEFLGTDWQRLEDLKRDDFSWNCFTQQGATDYIHANADFGIIAYAPSLNENFEYACPSKFGAYVTANVPILVSADCTYPAHLVEKYGVGLFFDSFQQIPDLLERLSPSEYQRMQEACGKLGEKIYGGYFFKRALTESLRRLRVN